MSRDALSLPAPGATPSARPLRATDRRGADCADSARSFAPRHELESHHATQALIDIGLVPIAPQRQAVAGQPTDGPRPLAGFPYPHAAAAALND